MSFAAIWLFLKSPLGRDLAMGLGIALLVAGASWYIYGKGFDSGKIAGAAEQLADDRKQQEQEHKQFMETLQSLQADAQAAHAEAAAQRKRADELSVALEQISRERAAARQQVSRVPDSGLKQDIVLKLALRPANDAAPDFYPAELRSIDDAVTQRPLVEQQIAKLDQKVDALERAQAAQADELKAVAGQRDASMLAYNQLMGHYVKAYNAFPHKGNLFLKIITFGIKGRAKHMDLPDPVTLQPETK